MNLITWHSTVDDIYFSEEDRAGKRMGDVVTTYNKIFYTILVVLIALFLFLSFSSPFSVSKWRPEGYFECLAVPFNVL